MKPLLKWPGGKSRLISQIQKHVPMPYNRYYEPFCGGAALFFANEVHRAVLNDVNPELISCYRIVAAQPDQVIRELRSLQNTEEAYLRIRSERPIEPAKCAARLIYLCRLSFNGIYRVNQQGGFNVPYSGRTDYQVCDERLIRSASSLLRNVELRCVDFVDAVTDAQEGDFVYLDPPYAVSTKNGFIQYNHSLFSWQDQMRVAQIAETLRIRGCHILVSNADHEPLNALYPHFRRIQLKRHSAIAGKGDKRKHITEALFVSCPR